MQQIKTAFKIYSNTEQIVHGDINKTKKEKFSFISPVYPFLFIHRLFPYGF